MKINNHSQIINGIPPILPLLSTLPINGNIVPEKAKNATMVQSSIKTINIAKWHKR